MSTIVKSYETQSIKNSLIQALVAEELKKQKTKREKELEDKILEQQALIDKLQMEHDMRKQRDKKTYRKFMDEADRYYFAEPSHNALAAVWWTMIGWLVLAFGSLFDALGM